MTYYIKQVIINCLFDYEKHSFNIPFLDNKHHTDLQANFIGLGNHLFEYNYNKTALMALEHKNANIHIISSH